MAFSTQFVGNKSTKYLLIILFTALFIFLNICVYLIIFIRTFSSYLYNDFMQISPTSIYVTVMVFIALFPRDFYFLISNKRRHSSKLFEGRYLLLFIVMLISDLACVFFTLFYSHTFFYNGIFFLWAILSGIFLALYLMLWVIFFMHGYDSRYQFKKYLVPAPMTVLSILVILLSGVCTLNYWLLISAGVYSISSYIWSLKGYNLTKPVIPDYVHISEDEDI